MARGASAESLHHEIARRRVTARATRARHRTGHCVPPSSSSPEFSDRSLYVRIDDPGL